METKNLISLAVEIVGLAKLARACNVTYPAIRKWERAGRLPRTEWTGETNYSSVIEKETQGRVTREQLLQLPAVQPVLSTGAALPAEGASTGRVRA